MPILPSLAPRRQIIILYKSCNSHHTSTRNRQVTKKGRREAEAVENNNQTQPRSDIKEPPPRFINTSQDHRQSNHHHRHSGYSRADSTSRIHPRHQNRKRTKGRIEFQREQRDEGNRSDQVKTTRSEHDDELASVCRALLPKIADRSPRPLRPERLSKASIYADERGNEICRRSRSRG